MVKSREQLIKEEQKILDDLIKDMDEVMYRLDHTLTESKLKKQKAKNLPDAYGLLVSAEYDKTQTIEQIRELRQSRNELYNSRIIVDYSDDYGEGSQEFKIGLHSYMDHGRIFIMNWKMQPCRYFIMDNSAEKFDTKVTDKHGNDNCIHYKLKLKRKVELFFDQVREVAHLYPLIDEETEKIVADEFLQELLNRRTEQEFRNIVFSIQKHQGQIIQTPFRQNLIVQGCAGSGKSMIMLHRLPIILFDNPNSLERTNLFIITPSQAYIHMANQMRIDLEIDDLNMGTLKQYYDFVIKKYKRLPEEYGKPGNNIGLSREQQKYIYSKECIQDIKEQFIKQLVEGKVNYGFGYDILGIQPENINREKTYSERYANEAILIQTLLDENEQILRKKYQAIWNVIILMDELKQLLKTRQSIVLREITKRIGEEEQIIEKAKKDMDTLSEEDNRVALRNRTNTITAASNRILKMRKTMEEIVDDREYFITLREMASQIEQTLFPFRSLKEKREQVPLEVQYRVINKMQYLVESSTNALHDVEKIPNKYWEYDNNYKRTALKINDSIQELSNISKDNLPLDYFEELKIARDYYVNRRKDAVHDTYVSIMRKIGCKLNSTGKILSNSGSPYLYTQILYVFYGPPNEKKESLITIDEAQNISVEELRLIYNVNDRGVIFNLFGDVKQHIEGEKGINSWNAFSDITFFKQEELQENYRNARQITEYCNRIFDLKMRAINLDGRGVHILNTKHEMMQILTGLLQIPKRMGLCSIIVKSQEEAESVMETLNLYEDRIFDWTHNDDSVFDRSQWNLLTVDQAKGLEFETVIAISGRMTKNEKYIAYTRALDELYVCDIQIEIVKKKNNETIKYKKDNPQNDESPRVRIKRPSKA